jgi:hypothetical protein
MTWEAFRSAALFGNNSPTSDGEGSFQEIFCDKFDALTPEDLIMSKEERRDRLEFSPFSLEPHLLSRNLTRGGRDDPNYGEARDLYQIVGNPDYNTDIIFFPNMMYAKSWYHYSDTVDYMFEMFGQHKDIADSPNFTKYIRHGVYPYDKHIVDKDGEPLSYEEHCLDFSCEGSDIRGAIPHEIRWYLTKFGFLDEAGVKLLRPVVAQWWC